MSWRRQNTIASDRFDVLEDGVPRRNCHVRGCTRKASYEMASPFGDRWFCARCRPIYRTHYRLVNFILRLPSRDILG